MNDKNVGNKYVSPNQYVIIIHNIRWEFLQIPLQEIEHGGKETGLSILLSATKSGGIGDEENSGILQKFMHRNVRYMKKQNWNPETNQSREESSQVTVAVYGLFEYFRRL